jgi:glycosyltransferase involved in cell wall biosynthesis
MTKKCVSIIIPTYNQNASLNATLNFFNQQTYQSDLFEVIVVDDGSDHPAEEYIGSCNKEFDYSVKFIRQSNKGRANARNTGIYNAQGKVLIFNDADRFPHCDFISKHMEHFSENDNVNSKVVIGCSYDYFGSYNHPEKIVNLSLPDIHKRARKPVFYSKITSLFNKNNYAESSIRWISYLVGNSSVKRADVVRIGYFDDSFSTWGAEHFDLAIRMVEQNYEFYLCEAAINYHIPHKREANFYKTNIESSVKMLVEKYSNEKYSYLKDFLFGDISLQELEKQLTGSISPALSGMEDIKNIIY